MTPVRVAFDVGPEHGHRTGIGVAVHELHRRLAQRADVTLIPYLLSARTRPEPPVRRLPLPAALAHRLWSRWEVPPVERLLGPIDVVHGTNYVVAPSRRARLVSVYDCWFLDHPDEATPIVRRAGHVLRRSVTNGAHVLASSHATAARVREHLDTDAVSVIHLGPPTAPTDAPGPPERAVMAATLDRPVVLALGTLERRKAIPTLVRAFGIVAAGDPDVVLVIAGADGDDADAVGAAVATLGSAARARVLRTGAIDPDTKRWLLTQARVLAYPSLDEGFGFPILEAQAAGVPVVASRAGSIPEVGGQGVELVATGDVEALASGISTVIRDDARRSALIAAGRANLARFSWSDTADATASLYRRLVEETR